MGKPLKIRNIGHRQQLAPVSRLTAKATASEHRMRGRTLQRERVRWFSLHPLCVECEKRGVTTLAQELDHIIPLHRGGLDFDRDRDTNRQGLCIPCHTEKTAAEAPGAGRV